MVKSETLKRIQLAIQLFIRQQFGLFILTDQRLLLLDVPLALPVTKVDLLVLVLDLSFLTEDGNTAGTICVFFK